MAAAAAAAAAPTTDLNADRLRSLPSSWSYGVSRGGRIFFINEEAKSTTWLHPLTGEAVITGHRRSPDLPTGWEEAYTFEGARYYINHNERKVTCKHPVTGQPSQDNCIFVVNEQSAATMTSEEKKDRPVNMISEAAHYNLTSDYAAHPMSPLGRTSRSSKKVHNFGKRSNSIKRNPNAPVVRRGWLYKQDSTGMKLWKKRWFVLSDLCLFYYRDEKEEGILGSILLPSFQISMLSAEDHINRKYAFKAAHPNMRTYYFCTDTGKEMELWMKAMIDAALVQTEPVKSIISYQTLPRNMPSHRAQAIPRYPEGYRTLPRNTKSRPESICSVTPSIYDKSLGSLPPDDKRRSMRDDTMWQLYEWQQRQFYNKQSTLTRHGTLSSPKTMININDQSIHMIPTSPSHGSIAGFQGYSPQRNYRSEVSSPVQRGDITIDRRHRSHHSKQHVFVPDRRSMPASLSVQPISPQSLQGKTLSQDECRGTLYKYRSEDLDIDTKLSRLCEQDKVVQALEEKLQQLHKEKYTLEQALLSASQEIEMNAENPAAIQNVILQRDDLQNGLLSTCREVSRATAELERAWREYDKLEYDVTVTKNHMQEQLERLGEVQSESAGIQRAQIQKELWRIQDVMEGLSKHNQQRNSTTEAGIVTSKAFTSKYKNEEEEVVPPRPPLPRSYDFAEHPPIIPPLPSDSSSLLCYSRGPVHLPEDRKIHQVQGYQRNGAHCGPDYRLYKSEPELTTVAEVDESNGEEKGDPVSESETSTMKGSHFPIGVVPPRTKSPTPESSTIASYVTLRKTKKIDLRTERPRSAVEQLCLAETTRPRMTVEEQMERIKRHQQACLKEKKRGLNIIGVTDLSPSQSPSLVRENPFRCSQNQRKDDFEYITNELEHAIRVNDVSQSHQNCVEDISWLKENDHANEHKGGFSRQLSKSDDRLSPDIVDQKEETVEKVHEKPTETEGTQDVDSPKSEAPVVNHKPESSTEESEETSLPEFQEDTLSSFEISAQTSRGNSTAAALPASAETIHG
uniref:Pleckstrin homology domain containing A5 n=1 Tax=Anolis carolinensis TaxID=28377 RepID=A0A803U1L4_ANOCA